MGIELVGPFPRGGRSSTGPSLVDPFLSRWERHRLSFLFSSNPPFVRIRTRDLSLLPTRDVNRPPLLSGSQRTLLRFYFPFERDVLIGRLEGAFPFATFTFHVASSSSSSRRRTSTTRASQARARARRHEAHETRRDRRNTWSRGRRRRGRTKVTVPPTWKKQPTGLVSQHTRKETKEKNQRAAVLSIPSTVKKKHKKGCSNKGRQDATNRWTGKDRLRSPDAKSTGSLLASKHRLLLANFFFTTVPTSRPKFWRSCLQFPA